MTESQRMRALDALVRWALHENPDYLPAEAAVQDEYTHDVLLRAMRPARTSPRGPQSSVLNPQS